MSTVFTERFEEPKFNIREILRYSGCGEADERISLLIEQSIEECKDKLSYTVCYCTFPISVGEELTDLNFITSHSKDLAKNLKECHKVVLFGATVGIGIDRLIAKYVKISPLKALVFQAIGAERIESLCDVFQEYITEKVCSEGNFVHPRFSPGYGDLPLDMQREIFNLLDCPKRIGLTLNNSLIMSPSKSVTGFMGIGKKPAGSILKCKNCKKTDCKFRRK